MLGQGEAALAGAGLREGAKDTVELVEGRLGPHTEAADVAAGGQGEEVQPVHLHDVNARNVAEGLCETLVLVVDHEGALAHDETAVAHLALTRAKLLGCLDMLQVLPDAEGGETCEGILGALQRLDVV